MTQNFSNIYSMRSPQEVLLNALALMYCDFEVGVENRQEWREMDRETLQTATKKAAQDRALPRIAAEAEVSLPMLYALTQRGHIKRSAEDKVRDALIHFGYLTLSKAPRPKSLILIVVSELRSLADTLEDTRLPKNFRIQKWTSYISNSNQNLDALGDALRLAKDVKDVDE